MLLEALVIGIMTSLDFESTSHAVTLTCSSAQHALALSSPTTVTIMSSYRNSKASPTAVVEQ